MSVRLTRVDYRMIHGQVITRWIKQCDINEIDAIDTALSNDEFMQEVFKMAAPAGVKIKIFSVDEAIKAQQEDAFDKRHCLLLFKTVPSIYEAVMKGFKMNEIQIGGLGGGKDRKAVNNAITLNLEDGQKLKEMEQKGIRIYLQTTPDYPSIELDEALKKL